MKFEEFFLAYPDLKSGDPRRGGSGFAFVTH